MAKKTFNLFNTKIDNITLTEAMNEVREFLSDAQNHFIVTPNPEIILKARKDGNYRRIINSADLKLPDGYGIVLASRILKFQIKQRVTGVDLLSEIFAYAEKHAHGCYLLVLDTGLTSIHDIDKYLSKTYPKLEYECQKVNKLYLASGHIISDINKIAPDILIIAFGAPFQEKWLARNIKYLTKVQVGMAVGGALDMLTGRIKRAPKILQNMHLEWLWRLYKQPKRVSRIFQAVVVFMWHVIVLRFRSLFIFRKNVVAFIYKNRNNILIIHKTPHRGTGDGHWAMVQGGVNPKEELTGALKREMQEELGITNVKITVKSNHKNRYRWSPFYRNVYSHRYAGQKQTCFFVQFKGNVKDIKMNHLNDERIDNCAWVSQKEFLKKIEYSRRKIAKKLLTEFNNKKIYAR